MHLAIKANRENRIGFLKASKELNEPKHPEGTFMIKIRSKKGEKTHWKNF